MSQWTCPTDSTHPVVTHPILGWPQCVGCGHTPDYAERAALAADLVVTIYTPTPGTPEAETIPAGAAVVGLESRHEHVTVYYSVKGETDAVEGWKAALDEAVHQLATATPTRQLMRAKASNLHRVGTVTSRTGQLNLAHTSDLLDWLKTA